MCIRDSYHSVSRLCEHGYVRPLKAEHVGNRPERTTYEILDPGLSAMRERIAALLATPTALSAADHAGLGELHNLSVCLLYTSDAADDLTRVDLGGRRIIK